MLATTKPDDEWMQRLRERGFTPDTVFPDDMMENLKRKLLSYGGYAVILAHPEPHFYQIMSRGVLDTGSMAVMRPMERSGCHRNVFSLWKANSEKITICTGWALSDDGCWRQHSWARQNNEIIETTTPRVAYFGFELTPQEAQTFG
jgi:hypothetical protein